MSSTKKLDEIIETARRAIRVADAKVLDVEVTEIDKKSFVSIGGSFDSILILALSIKEEQGHSLEDEKRDAIDRPERHSIAGGMNNPSPMQVEAFEEENNDNNL